MSDRDWARLASETARPVRPVQVPQFVVHLPFRRDQLGGDSREIEASGGCIALLLLVEALVALGRSAIAIPFDEPPSKGGALASSLASGETIAVFPEGIVGNPLRARRVVRWVLYYVSLSKLREWRQNRDLVLCYWQHFLPDGETARTLRLLDAGLDFFVDQGQPRNGVGFHFGKSVDDQGQLIDHERPQILRALATLPAHPKIGELHSQLATRSWIPSDVPANMTRREICATFNSLALFITYDNDTALSYLAALCGCPSVVIPLEQMRLGHHRLPIRNGVAFGWAGLPDALDTMLSLRRELKGLEEGGHASVQSFLRAVSSHFPFDRGGDGGAR